MINVDNDKLLELAAAAREKLKPFCASSIQDGKFSKLKRIGKRFVLDNKPWNPLVSDSDALCLSVWLKIDLLFRENSVTAIRSDNKTISFDEKFADTNIFHATRRAIVRAAASIEYLQTE